MTVLVLAKPAVGTSRAIIASSALAVVLACTLSGCGPAANDEKSVAAFPVKVSHPVERQVTEYSDLTGRTAAVDSIQVRARVWGYVDKFDFNEGNLVKEGDVLFEIDPRTYKATLDEAKGKLVSLQARVVRLEADFERAKRLVKKNTIAQEEFDRAVGDLAETKGAVEAQKAVVEQAKLDLGFTKVTAPVNGRVGRALVTKGNLVQAGPMGGTLLTTLVSVDPIYAYFDADERSVLRVRQMIREGKFKSARESTWPVFLGLANEEGYPHEGTIDFVDNQVNPNVGTLRLRGVFANKDETLSPGYFVRVRIPIGHPRPAVLVSDRAIDADQGQKIVYVVGADNKVAIRNVRLGKAYDGLRAIDEGLSTSDRVIVTGLQHLRVGMTVAPTIVELSVAR